MTVLLGLQKIHMGTFSECHWPVNDSFQKVTLTGQWHFERCRDLWGGAPLGKCHWPVNDSFETVFWKVTFILSVNEGRCVIQWLFSSDMVDRGAPLESVIDRSMTVFTETLYRGAPLGNCHWPVNDSFQRDPVQGCTFGKMSLTGQWHFWWNLQKVSLTGQWHFSGSPCTGVHL